MLQPLLNLQDVAVPLAGAGGCLPGRRARQGGDDCAAWAKCRVPALLALLLVLFLLLAQAGALAHGVSHILDQAGGGEPVCEQCLAYAPMGAGAASTPSAWIAPAATVSFDAAVPAASPTGFRPGYQSRAPPRLHR